MNPETKFNKVTETEKFDRIVGAILAGKYSWACVLMLRFAGYNPLQYIPYRTYNRLMKNNPEQNNSEKFSQNNLNQKLDKDSIASYPHKSSDRSTYQIDDLNYLEQLSRSDKQLRGGSSLAFSADWDFSQDDFEILLERSAIAF